MKTRLKTILLIFSVTLTLSVLLFAELANTANAVDTASQSISNTEARLLGTQENAPAAVNLVFTVNIVGGAPGVNDVTKSPPPDPVTGEYAAPLTVTLTAVPHAAWRFDHWDDDLADTVSPKDVYVTDGASITAHFVQRCFTLTTSHTGSGLDPAATPLKSTQCPAAGQYVAGEVINLSATADPHWAVSGWSGTNNNASTLSTNTATMPANDLPVSVNYTPICYTLSTSVVPTVAGIINRAQGPNCPAPGPVSSYLEGTVETLTATSYNGYRFSNWSGAATGTVAQTAVTMDNNYSVTANFEKGCHPLILKHDPAGTGSNPQADPPNSTGCNPGEYVFDQNILLQNAIPIPGWRVDSWVNTEDDSSTEGFNFVIFPKLPASAGSEYAVTVNYVQKPTLDFSAATYTVNEDAISATILVNRSGSSQEEVTVLVKSSDDTATAGDDYLSVNETLTFPQNINEQTFTVQIYNDPTSEGTESLILSLSDQSVGAELGPQATAEVIILDDEGGSTVQLSSTTYTAPEISSSATVTISLFPPSNHNVFVQFNTSAGTATSGEDYVEKSELILFLPDETSKQLSITLADDTLDEIDETVQLKLPFVQGAGRGESDAVLTILDDDDPPSVQFSTNQYYATEGEATAPLTVTLSAATSLTVTVDYTVLQISNGRQIVGKIKFDPGEVTKAINVPIAVNQAEDTLNALLNSAENASLASPSSANLKIHSKDRSECHLLTLEHTGYGSPPLPPSTMTQSEDCPLGRYVATDLIPLHAQPDLGWTIDGWHGTLNDDVTIPENVVSMPDGDHTVTAYYITSSFLPNISNIYIDYFDGPTETEPNNALDTSSANGPIRSGESYVGNFPIAADKWDIFYFTLATRKNVQIDLTGVPGSHDYNLYLFADNEKRDIVGYSGSVDNADEHISNSNLDPGVYFVAVHSAVGAPTFAQYSMKAIFE